MASAASNVAKTASQVGGGSSRRKVDTISNEAVDPESRRTLDHNGISDNSLGSSKSNSNNKNMLQKTFKNIKKGAKKVDPRRVASAVKTQIQGDHSNSLTSQLGTEEAEDAVLSSVEKRSKYNTKIDTNTG